MKILFISVFILCLTGCQSNNNTNYSCAKELQELKFPAGSLAKSNRYDIPVIPNNSERVLEDVMPPDY